MVIDMFYCYSCNRRVSSTVKMVQETYLDRGKHVTSSSIFRVCDRCGKEIPDDDIDEYGVRKEFRKYQKHLIERKRSR